MIDYEKIKLANKLTKKFTELTGISTVLRIGFFTGGAMDFGHSIYFGKHGMDKIENTSIDEIISKLIEFISLESKYKVGQEIWIQSCLRNEDNVMATYSFSGTVIPSKECDYGLSEIYVRVIDGNDEHAAPESFCYPSRQALIEHQIEYWQSLQKDHTDKVLADKCGLLIKDICQHESDGLYYTSNPPQKKCVRCREFYR